MTEDQQNTVAYADESEHRDRQSGIVNYDITSNLIAYVIGLGSVGHLLCSLIHKLEFLQIVMVDSDHVHPVNLVNQGYDHSDIGMSKAQATLRKLTRTVPTEEGAEVYLREDNLIAHHSRFMDAHLGMFMFNDSIIFSCVDNFETRRHIFMSARVNERCKWFIDCRMGRNNCRILTINLRDPVDCIYYATTLLDDDEGFDGGCTARGTYYSSAVIAGIAVSQAVCAIHGQRLAHARDILFNLSAMELIDGSTIAAGAGAGAETR